MGSGSWVAQEAIVPRLMQHNKAQQNSHCMDLIISLSLLAQLSAC